MLYHCVVIQLTFKEKLNIFYVEYLTVDQEYSLGSGVSFDRNSASRYWPATGAGRTSTKLGEWW